MRLYGRAGRNPSRLSAGAAMNGHSTPGLDRTRRASARRARHEAGALNKRNLVESQRRNALLHNFAPRTAQESKRHGISQPSQRSQQAKQLPNRYQPHSCQPQSRLDSVGISLHHLHIDSCVFVFFMMKNVPLARYLHCDKTPIASVN